MGGVKTSRLAGGGARRSGRKEGGGRSRSPQARRARAAARRPPRRRPADHPTGQHAARGPCCVAYVPLRQSSRSTTNRPPTSTNSIIIITIHRTTVQGRIFTPTSERCIIFDSVSFHGRFVHLHLPSFLPPTFPLQLPPILIYYCTLLYTCPLIITHHMLLWAASNS